MLDRPLGLLRLLGLLLLKLIQLLIECVDAVLIVQVLALKSLCLFPQIGNQLSQLLALSAFPLKGVFKLDFFLFCFVGCLLVSALQVTQLLTKLRNL